MRYPVSGILATGLGAATEAARYLLGVTHTAGRTLWLRGAWALATASGGQVALMDASESATTVESKIRFRFYAASHAPVSNASDVGLLRPAGSPYGKVDFPAPGIKFATDCVIVIPGVPADFSTLAVAHAGGYGYEEA